MAQSPVASKKIKIRKKDLLKSRLTKNNYKIHKRYIQFVQVHVKTKTLFYALETKNIHSTQDMQW